MSAIQEMSKADLAAGYARFKSQAARLREKGEIVSDRLVSSVVTTTAGYAVGLARNKLGEGEEKRITIPGLNVDLTLWAPGLMQVMAVAGLAGKNTPRALELANGMAAGHWAIEAFLNGLPGEGR